MKSNEQIEREVSAMSLVRQNLLTRIGYVPYCGRGLCMHRAAFNGSQFACRCGWVSQFPADFIEQYKAAQAKLAAGVQEPSRRCAGCDLPNGCPEYCWCDAAGAGKAEYASWFPIVPAGVKGVPDAS